MYVTSTSIVWSCSPSQPNLLLPLFLSFQPQAAEGDIFAAEDSKKKTKPKGTKKEKSIRNQKVIQMRTSLVLQIIFWRFLAAAKTKTKKKKKGGTNYSKTSLICPSNLRALSLATQINILFLVSAYIYAGHRCVTCVFSM